MIKIKECKRVGDTLEIKYSDDNRTHDEPIVEVNDFVTYDKYHGIRFKVISKTILSNILILDIPKNVNFCMKYVQEGTWLLKCDIIDIKEYGYFTPKPEDIHLGYMLEGREDPISDIWYHFTYTHFSDSIFDVTKDKEGNKHYTINPELIRTPYLTKEQIEKEGWKFVTSNDWDTNMCDRFTKKAFDCADMIFIDYEYAVKKMTLIVDIHEMNDILGDEPILTTRISCPSINEFRTIMKLLRIDSNDSIAKNII